MLGFIVSARMSGYSLSITILKNQGMVDTFLETYFKKSEEAFNVGCQREDTRSSLQHSIFLNNTILMLASTPEVLLNVRTKCKTNATVGLVLEVAYSSMFVEQQETRGFRV